MTISNGQIPSINIPALAATFSFDAGDDGGTVNSLTFGAAGARRGVSFRME